MIMEFAENGNLRDFLRDNRHHFLYPKSKQYTDQSVVSTDISEDVTEKAMTLTFTDLMSMAYQVARGMDYLAQRKVSFKCMPYRERLVFSDEMWISRICPRY